MQYPNHELAILGALEHRAVTPADQIAQLLQVKTSRVRYCIQKFTQQGIIVATAPFINPYPLGYVDYTLFISLLPLSKTQKERLIQQLIKTDGVSWVAMLGGEYQLGVAITASAIEEVKVLFNNLGAEFQTIFGQKTISLRLRFCAFGRKYLCPEAKKTVTLIIQKTSASIAQLNSLDQKILSTLSNTEFRSHREFARSSGIALSTWARRVSMLENQQVICGYIYRLNVRPLGISTYRILIQARSMSSTFASQVYQFAKSHPRIIHFIECLGSWDYELGVEVSEPVDLNMITEEIFSQFGSEIVGLKTLQVLRHLKFSSYPFSGKNLPNDA